jgi:tetratricopeptide (TPR) repeat protein
LHFRSVLGITLVGVLLFSLPQLASVLCSNVGIIYTSRFVVLSEGELQKWESERVYWIAKTSLQRALTWDNENITAFRELGRLYLLESELSLAIRTLKQALVLDSEDDVVRLMLGEVYYTDGRYNEAAEVWWKAEVGDFFWSRREFHKAALTYQVAMERDSAGYSCSDYIQLGDAWTYKLKFEGRYRKWLQQEIEKVADYIDWQTALSAYNKAVDLCPDSVAAREGLAFVLYWGSEDFQESVQELQLAIELTSSSEEQFWWALELGEWYRQNSYPQEALRWFDFAGDIDPHSREPYIRRGLTFQKQLDLLDKAIEEFELAVEKEPTSPYPYYYLGEAYQEAGRLEEAVAAYRKLVAMQPEVDSYREILEQAEADLANQ